ncbi:MAG: 3-phosphoserine/phosphohydroxythreonine transaminase [Endozoicomonadaceae bacterium]|nr:3-phosphoserine/phosphohydroxythreonine transaminase [Endozoicomonadaceae bacterium]
MNKRLYNFSAGPAALPLEVLLQVQSELLNWDNHGFSILESSHRIPEFIELTERIEQDFRRIMSVPDHYHVLFSSGGASFQFSGVPLNMIRHIKRADYFCTGLWSQKAINEAKRYCDIHLVAQGNSSGYLEIPDESSWSFSEKAAYIFYTPNETVNGVRFKKVPKSGNVPVVSDLTSCIFQENININDFGIIFAATQKNLGLAGFSVIIIRDDLLEQALPDCPNCLNYKTLLQSKSMPNTPPTFAWYFVGKMLQWIESQGGVSVLEARSQQQGRQLYDMIDQSHFYTNRVSLEYRSMINIPFFLKDNTLTTQFIESAKAAGITQLKGHKTVGGLRASLYIGLHPDAVKALISFMKNFEKKYG